MIGLPMYSEVNDILSPALVMLSVGVAAKAVKTTNSQ